MLSLPCFYFPPPPAGYDLTNRTSTNFIHFYLLSIALGTNNLLQSTNCTNQISMAAVITVDDLLGQVPYKARFERCSNIVLAHVANKITLSGGGVFSQVLGINPLEVQKVCTEAIGSKWHQVYALLCKWKSKLGSEATYVKLIKALWALNNHDLAEEVTTCLCSPPQWLEFLELFRTYLQECYLQMPPPCALLWPLVDKMDFIEPTMVLHIAAHDQPSEKVQVKDIFKAGIYHGQRKVTLLEGPAGSGKSSLVWHIEQMWADEKLFQDFSLVIHVSLRNEAIQTATSLAEVIPYPSDDVRKAIAQYIKAYNGNGVAFVFEEWEEAFLKLGNSFVLEMLHGVAEVRNASILITSRPIAATSLHTAISSKIILQGFSERQVEQYFYRNQDHSDLSTYMSYGRLLLSNPFVAGLCHLPLNSAIIILLLEAYKTSSAHYNLPQTRNELWKSLILNVMVRQIDELDESLKDFESLPAEMKQKFNHLCAIAFGCSIYSKSFTMEEFTETFGLVLRKPVVTPSGCSQDYTFVHSCIQEFLAALHMASLPQEQQIRAAERVYTERPLSQVLLFFAGVANKKDVVRVLSALVCYYQARKQSTPTLKLLVNDPDYRQRLTLLQLVRCVYELQLPDICYALSYVLTSVHSIEYLGKSLLSFPRSIEIGDCTCVGYFLANSCMNVPIAFDISWCAIGNLGVRLIAEQFTLTTKSKRKESNSVVLPSDWLSQSGGVLGGLVVGLRKSQSRYYWQQATNADMSFVLCSCQITHEGVRTLCRLAQSMQFISELQLSSNLFPPFSDIPAALKILIETLSRTPTLISLDFASNSLRPQHAWFLALLIAASARLQHIYINQNYIGSGILILAAAFGLNRSLRLIALSGCHINDTGLLSLGDNLCRSSTLEVLTVPDNGYDLSTFMKFLLRLQYCPCLKYVSHSLALSNTEKQLISQINHRRCKQGFPKINVTTQRESLKKGQETRMFLQNYQKSPKANKDAWNDPEMNKFIDENFS